MTTTLKGDEHTIWSSNTTTLRQVLIIVLYGSKVRKKNFLEERVVRTGLSEG